MKDTLEPTMLPFAETFWNHNLKRFWFLLAALISGSVLFLELQEWVIQLCIRREASLSGPAIFGILMAPFLPIAALAVYIWAAARWERRQDHQLRRAVSAHGNVRALLDLRRSHLLFLAVSLMLFLVVGVGTIYAYRLTENLVVLQNMGAAPCWNPII